jgi:type II secretory pathway pseudopilin PulG
MRAVSDERPGHRRAGGFTLIELAVVLAAVALLIGGLLAALSTQIEMGKVRSTQSDLKAIGEALVGFASARGYLPCPATPASRGVSDPPPPTVPCARYQGLIPAATLGLALTSDEHGVAVDSWGNPYYYAVTDADSAAFVTPPPLGIKGAWAAGLNPDLRVCPRASSSGTACEGADTPLADGVVAVWLSLGPDGREFLQLHVDRNPQAPADETENCGEVAGAPVSETVAAPPAREYFLPNDDVFVARPRAGRAWDPIGDPGTTGDDTFDDLVEWLSPYVLYSRMLTAGQLP